MGKRVIPSVERGIWAAVPVWLQEAPTQIPRSTLGMTHRLVLSRPLSAAKDLLKKTSFLPVLILASVLTAPTAIAQEFCSPALYYLSRGDYARAQNESRRDEGTPASRMNIQGVAEMMSGRQREAIVTLRAALKSDPGYLPARLNLGIALYQQELHAEAAAELERVFQNESALKGNAAYHRGLVAIESDDPRAALIWLQRAIEFDPGLADAHLQIGQVHEHLGELQLAGRSYRSYLAHHPESPAGLLRFGIAAQRAGHIETARRYLRLVLDVAPDSAEAVEARKFFVIWD